MAGMAAVTLAYADATAAPVLAVPFDVADSDSWVAQKNNQLRIFELFLLHSSHSVKRFDLCCEATLCRRQIWDALAEYAVNVYRIGTGNAHSGCALACSSVNNLLGALINRAAIKFKPTVPLNGEIPS